MKKATRKQTKKHNRNLILNIIYNSEQISRAELAKISKLTRTTVSEIVAALIRDGLVKEIGQGQSSGGKPPTLLKFKNHSRQIIGLDLGSNIFRGAIIDLKGEIKHRASQHIQDHSGLDALEVIYQLIDELLTFSQEPVLGIGIGSPGIMDSKNGVVRTSVNLDWEDLPLADILRERYNLEVYIANDCQVSALAENVFGNSGGARNLVLMKIGHGVGAGVVINQLPYYGDSFGAGEIGHVKIEPEGEACSCGSTGCLETRISSRAIIKKAVENANADLMSPLNTINPGLKDTTLEHLQVALEMGDPGLEEIISNVSIDIAKALSFMISMVNIHNIVIAGSVSVFSDRLIKPIQEYISSSVLPALSEGTQISTSSLGADIVMLGAAAVVMQNELGIL